MKIRLCAQKMLLLSIGFLFSTVILAQTGKISGRVISSKTGISLIGATVSIDSLSRSIATDLNGSYSFGGLAAGNYTVSASYVSYSKKIVTEVLVVANETTELIISLDEPAVSSNNEVIVTTRLRRENIGSLLAAQKNSASTSDGISAEQIRRTPDRNTSDVLKRVSGASIQDDRFAIIRGLNDRYNAAFLNGAPLPSSESDRKAFAFNIFPSNILDNLVIYKTATPDRSGEFGGGIIDITTKSIPTQNFNSISFGVGYNTITSFKNARDYKGSKTDLLGLDNGKRDLPANFPDLKNFPGNPADRANLAKSFKNDWAINDKTALPNLNFQYAKGLNFDRKGKEFAGILLSLTYNRFLNTSEGETNSYEFAPTSTTAEPVLRGSFVDKTYRSQTLLGALANFSFKLDNNNRVSFKNIFSINGDDRVIERSGRADLTSDPDALNRSSARWFTSNSIYSSQLIGEHFLAKSKWTINWLGSFSSVNRSIPNLRQLTYGFSPGRPGYEAAIGQGTISADNAGSMFYSDTKEKIYNGKFDLIRNFKIGSTQNQFKIGGYYQFRDRGFEARVLGFSKYFPAGFASFDNSLLLLPEDRIFDPANMGLLANGKGGFQVLDGTKPYDKYTASSALTAGYAMLDQRLGKGFRVIYGARIENFNQKLDALRNFGDTVKLNTSKTDVLPSINFIYSINTKQNVRLSYTQTLNRPEFRELAPFAFFDFQNRYTISGVDSLQRATIKNYDLRYEFYPGRSQLFSISGFYKDFTNPIELVSNPNTPGEAVYQNAVAAKIYGVELEFRSLISSFLGSGESSIWNKLTLASNASFVTSEVRVGDFGSISAKDLIEKRPLQGQSPYVFNVSLIYADDARDLSFTFSANRVGPRIFIVGSVNEPDNWEFGRTVLDFQASKNLLKDKLELRLNVRDLLAQKQIYFLDKNLNNKYDKGSDNLFQSQTFGQTISLSASYQF